MYLNIFETENDLFILFIAKLIQDCKKFNVFNIFNYVILLNYKKLYN